MTAENENRPEQKKLTYESWLESTKLFDQLSSQRQTELLQSGIKLFSRTIKETNRSHGLYYRRLVELKESGEFKGFLDFSQIHISEDGSKIEFGGTLESKVDIRLLNLEKPKSEIRVDYHRSFTFDSPGGRSIEQPALTGLSNIQIVKLINSIAQEAKNLPNPGY